MNPAHRYLIGPLDGTPVNPTIVRKVDRDDLPTGGIGIVDGLLAPAI